jgi:hypothetical protein
MGQINGLVNLTGNTITLPKINDTVAMDATSTNLNLVDDNDFLFTAMRRMVFSTIGNYNSFTETKTGSGLTGFGTNMISVNTGVTASSTARRHTTTGYHIFSTGGITGNINFAKDFLVIAIINRLTADDHSEVAARFQIKAATTEGALGAPGLGLLVGLNADSYLLQAENYQAHLNLTTFTTATSLSDNINTEIMIYHRAAVSDNWYVDGVLKHTDTDANHIPSGNVSATIAVTIINGATGGHDCYWRVGQIIFGTGK